MPRLFGPPVCVWNAATTFGEGPCWSTRLQALCWVDTLGHRLHRYRPGNGACNSWPLTEEISAVAERSDAPGLVVTLRRGYALFDRDAGTPAHTLHQPAAEPPGNRFNDGKCDRAGRFCGGTMDFACKAPTGALHCFGPDGQCVRYEMGCAVTNGPTWSLDQRTMYLNDTVCGCVNAFDFDADTGALSNQRVWLRLAQGDGYPDGMTTDAAGRIWIAHRGGACVSCHDPASGAELGRVTLPASHVTNCAFGRPDMRTLFITCARDGLTAEQLARGPLAGGLFAVELDAAGLPASMFRG